MFQLIGWDDDSRAFFDFSASHFPSAPALAAHRVSHRFWPADLPESLRSYRDQPLYCLQLFTIGAGITGQIHKDGIGRLAAVNIPFSGCETATMDWFSDDWPLEQIPATGSVTRIPSVQTINPVPTSQVILTEPTLVNTDEWHRIDNSGGVTDRKVISIRLYPNPTFEELRQALVFD